MCITKKTRVAMHRPGYCLQSGQVVGLNWLDANAGGRRDKIRGRQILHQVLESDADVYQSKTMLLGGFYGRWVVGPRQKIEAANIVASAPVINLHQIGRGHV